MADTPKKESDLDRIVGTPFYLQDSSLSQVYSALKVA